MARVTDRVQGWINWLYLQWCVHTTACMLEPWEVKMLNTIAVAALLCVLYTSYVFLPSHINMIVTNIRIVFYGASSNPVSTGDPIHQEM